MNKTIKMLFCSAVLAVSAFGALVAPAAAINIEQLQVAQLNGNVVAEVIDSDKSKCIDLFYTGTSTEALVTITSTLMSAYAPYNVADTSFGNSGSYALDNASYDTVGELCDAINVRFLAGSHKYKCVQTGCQRNTNTTRLRDQTETSGTNNLGAAAGASILVDLGSDDLRVGINPTSGRQVRLKSCTANVNTTGTLKVYGKLRKFNGASDGVTRDDTSQVWSVATVDDTDKTITFTVTGGGGGLDFDKDEHVVIVGTGAGAAGTVGQIAANNLTCYWEELAR